MRISVRHQPATAVRCDLLLLPVTTRALRSRKGTCLAGLDRALGGALRTASVDDGFKAGAEQSLLLHSLRRLPAARVALLGLGDKPPASNSDWRALASRAIRLAQGVRAKRVAMLLPVELARQAPVVEVAAALVEGAQLTDYRFDRYKTRPGTERAVVELLLVPEARCVALTRTALQRGEALARATSLARDLVNEPACELTPRHLARHARGLAREHSLRVRVLGRAQLHRLRMGLLEAVASGSREPPCVVHLVHRPRRRCGPRVALVGKGVTFDAGGLDIKPAASMLSMKSDMAGAAAVLATMRAVACLQLPLEVHAWLACAENLLGGAACKPGDVVRSRAGLSVEIGNTDAEGRLLLADAFSLAATTRPEVMVDVATLTGACAVGLGPNIAGLFSPDDELARALMAAGQATGEPCWRLPLDDSLKGSIKSALADLKNTGGRSGGAITAALFLREFVPAGVRWAHLDIAGPAWVDTARDHIPKGATGFGSALLVRWLEGLARVDRRSNRNKVSSV